MIASHGKGGLGNRGGRGSRCSQCTYCKKAWSYSRKVRGKLSSFLSLKGILHQSTCLHTPQQNGIAERKNRHLVETAHSLMLNTNVPVHHWGDAVLTACFFNKLDAFFFS